MKEQKNKGVFMDKKVIPIVYALDDKFVPFLSVSIQSILENGDNQNFYKFYVLNQGIDKSNIEKLGVYNTENSSVEFINVLHKIKPLMNKLCVRDNYSEEIYFRFFIPSLLPEYDKIIYIDSDTVVNTDIAKLYEQEIDDYVLGVVTDETVANLDLFVSYVEQYLGVPQKQYFNSGVLLINSKQFNEQNILDNFVKALEIVTFRVAPDQDYLNVLCKGKVKYLDLGWNKMPINPQDFDDKEIKLIHFNLNLKPWKYDGIAYSDYFWKYAKKSLFYNHILQIKNSYGEEDEKIAKRNFERLITISKDCLNKEPSTIFDYEEFNNAFGISNKSIK